MDLVNIEETFAEGFWERKFVFYPEVFTIKKINDFPLIR